MPKQPDILDYIKQLENRIAKLESGERVVSYDSNGDINTRLGGLWFDKTTGTKYGIDVNTSTGSLEIFSDNYVDFIESDGSASKLKLSLNNGGSIVSSGRAFFQAKINTGSYAPISTIVWNSETTDNTSSYNASNGIFTVPFSGFYLFGFNILLPSAGAGEYRVGFYVNDAIYNTSILTKLAGEWQTIYGISALAMTANQTMRVKYTAGSGNIYTDANYNTFWGMQLL